MTISRLLLVVTLTVTYAGCSDSTGPSGLPPGKLIAAGRGPLEWSRDGTQIYYRTDSVNTGPILSVNVSTGVSRVVVPTCASSPQETIGGLAYISDCAAPRGLHLLLGGDAERPAGYDSVLAPGASWVTRTADRTRLIYGFLSVGAISDSVGVIDLVRDTRHAIATGPFSPTASVSPAGTEMLVERSATTGRFAILNLDDGTLRSLDDSLWSFLEAPVPIGWNDAGVWVILGAVDVYDPATGTWHGTGVGGSRGTVEAPGRRATVGEDYCLGEDSAGCLEILYSLWVLDPLQSPQLPVVQFTTADVLKYDFGFHAAFSPDGESLAYSLGFELRLLRLTPAH